MKKFKNKFFPDTGPAISSVLTYSPPIGRHSSALGKTLSRRSEIAAKCRVDFFIFSLSDSRKNMIFHIFYLIKKLCKMPKFAKFMLVISLFNYSRKNFFDRCLNLPRGMTCLQNIFFDVDFLISFELFKHFCVFQIFLMNQCTTENSISVGTSPCYLG